MKKWTYLVAAILAGTTPVFTGCIDNDEPEGISILRGAQADLLKAQAALENARQAEVTANAALITAQAKLEEAKAANELAEAKIKEAIAKQEETKNEILQTKNELEKAELENQLRLWENEQKEWEAQQQANIVAAENAQKEWELAYKKLEAEYEKVLVELATKKNTLVASQQAVLNPYINRLDLAQDNLHDKNTEYNKAYNDYLAALQTVEDAEANKEYLTRDAEWKLKKAEAALAGQEAALEEAQAKLQEAQDMQATDLYQKKLDLQAQVYDLEKELKELRISVFEEIQKVAANEWTTWFDMDKALTEQASQMKEIPAYKVDYTAGVFPWSVDGTTTELKATSYSLSDVQNFANGYRTRLNDLANLIDMWNGWVRDEDDNVWTKEQISRLELVKTQVDEYVVEMKDLLNELIKAYNAGNYPSYDPTAIEGYDVLDNAVIAFNAAVDEYNKVVDQIAANEKTIADAEQTYIDAHAAAGTKKDETVKAAEADAEQKKKDAAAKIDPVDKALNAAIITTQTTYDAYAADPTNVDKENAWLKAKADQETAQKAYDAVYDVYSDEAIAEALQKAKDDADKLCGEEQAAALKTYNDVKDPLEAENATLTASITAPDGEKYKALYDANEAVVTEFNKYKTRVEQFASGEVLPTTPAYIRAAIANTNAEGKYDWKLSTDDLTKMDRNALENVMMNCSQYLYGDAAENSNGVPPIVFDDAEIEAKIQNLVENTIDPNTGNKVVGQAYFDAFNNYGLVGGQLYYKAVIDWANAVIADNGESVKTLIADAQAAYDALKNEGETALETWQANREACDALYEEVKNKIAEAKAPIDAKIDELQPVRDMLYVVESAIKSTVYLASEGASYTDLETYIDACEKAVEDAEKAVYKAETKVMEKQKLLNDWNSGNISALEYAENAMNIALSEVEYAQEKVTTARTLLEKVLDQLSVEGLETTTPEVQE